MGRDTWDADERRRVAARYREKRGLPPKPTKTEDAWACPHEPKCETYGECKYDRGGASEDSGPWGPGC